MDNVVFHWNGTDICSHVIDYYGPAFNPNDAFSDAQAHRANMEPIWGQQDPGGPHVGPMKLALWDSA